MTGRVEVRFGPENNCYESFGEHVEKNSFPAVSPKKTPLQFIGELKDSKGKAYHLKNTTFSICSDVCIAYSSSARKARHDIGALENLTAYEVKILKEIVF